MKINGPWKIKSSKIKYKNPWIKIREDQASGTNGKNSIFGIVEMVAGVSVLPIDKEGYVYLTKEFRYAIEQDSIEVTGGALDKNESPLDAGKRELKEELGIEAEEWINLGTINPFTMVIKSPATLFLAKKISFSKSNPDENEKIDIIKIKFKKALKMVMNGQITHSPSCALILKAAIYLKNK